MSSVSSTSCLTAVVIVDRLRGDEIGEPARLGDVHRQRLQIVGQQRRQRHDLLEVRLDVPGERVDLEPVGVVGVLGRRADARAQVGLGRDDLVEREPREPLHDEPQAAVGQLEHLVNVRRGADRVQVVLPRLLHGRVALGEDRDQLAVGDRIVDEPHRALARDRQRHERIRKEDRVPKRENRQLRRNRERPIADRDVLGLRLSSLIAHGDLIVCGLTRTAIIEGVVEAVGRRRAPPPAEPHRWDAGTYMSRKSDVAPRRAASCRSRCSATSRASSQSLQRTAKGSARSRFSAISSPHSKQLP